MIHKAIMDYVRERLERELISNVGNADDTRAGVIKLGPLQGDPDPDIARISIELYENDPDEELKGSGIGSNLKPWKDEVAIVEVGGGITWRRRFTVKARVLLESTREDLENARRIASTVRTRVERSIMRMSFSGVEEGGEYVSLPALAETLQGEMVQAGGPPDAYDFFIKVKFEVMTTQMILEE